MPGAHRGLNYLTSSQREEDEEIRIKKIKLLEKKYILQLLLESCCLLFVNY